MFTFGNVNSELRREGGESHGLLRLSKVYVLMESGRRAPVQKSSHHSFLAQFWLPTVFAGHICWDTCVGIQKTLPAHFVDGRHPIRDCEYWLLCSLFHTGLFFSCLSVLCFLFTISQQQRRRARAARPGISKCCIPPCGVLCRFTRRRLTRANSFSALWWVCRVLVRDTTQVEALPSLFPGSRWCSQSFY